MREVRAYVYVAKTISAFYLLLFWCRHKGVFRRFILAIPVPGNGGLRFLVEFVGRKKKRQRVSGEDFRDCGER